LETLGSFQRESKKIPGLIVSVGRLIKVKGHEYVIKAFAKVLQTVPHARLEIYGEGDYRPELERLVKRTGLTDAVQFVGHVGHTELFRRISQASVFVLASESKADNLPNSVKEAMAIGIPVITTPTTAISELVRDGVSGQIVPMRSVEAISQSLLRILENPELALRLSHRAAKDVEDRFDLTNTTQMRKNLYCELAEDSKISSIADSSSSNNGDCRARLLSRRPSESTVRIES
jgi:colanic acid/amylovoran biosynthesis glycosyltransferase